MVKIVRTYDEVVTIFTRILRGELPGTFVHQDEICGVFLSINPLAPGHALVVPRLEVDHWIDLPEGITSHLMSVAQRVGKAQQAAFDCRRVALIVAGYDVPHVHIHVVPTSSMHQLNFANAAAVVSKDELMRAAAQIVARIAH